MATCSYTLTMKRRKRKKDQMLQPEKGKERTVEKRVAETSV